MKVLVYYVATNWGANGLTDYVLQFALVCGALGGFFLFLIGTGGLRLRRGRTASHHRKTATAAS